MSNIVPLNWHTFFNNQKSWSINLRETETTKKTQTAFSRDNLTLDKEVVHVQKWKLKHLLSHVQKGSQKINTSYVYHLQNPFFCSKEFSGTSFLRIIFVALYNDLCQLGRIPMTCGERQVSSPKFRIGMPTSRLPLPLPWQSDEPKQHHHHQSAKRLDALKKQSNCSYLRLSPLPVTVTTRIITFLIGNPYKPSFATVTGRGDNPTHILFEGNILLRGTLLY